MLAWLPTARVEAPSALEPQYLRQEGWAHANAIPLSSVGGFSCVSARL